MERFLLFIKHHLGFIWEVIELSNDIVFSIHDKPKLEETLISVFSELSYGTFSFRKLSLDDIICLNELITRQPEEDLMYFRPHKFDLDSLRKQAKKKAFLMMGAFDGERIVGYFFLRFFVNRKCFVGRLIDKQYRGKGIGQTMNSIMYETAWRMKYRCLSTISRNNRAVIRAHSRNENMILLKELPDDYLLVEFIKI